MKIDKFLYLDIENKVKRFEGAQRRENEANIYKVMTNFATIHKSKLKAKPDEAIIDKFTIPEFKILWDIFSLKDTLFFSSISPVREPFHNEWSQKFLQYRYDVLKPELDKHIKELEEKQKKEDAERLAIYKTELKNKLKALLIEQEGLQQLDE